MSTNGFIIFLADGERKNSYNHWDSGPCDLGVKVLAWLRYSTSTPARARALYEDIKRLQVVSDEVPPTTAQREELAIYADSSVAGGEWYGLLRRTQGNPEMILQSGYTVDEDEPYGWQYVIDTDAKMFHVETGYSRANWSWSDLPDDQTLCALEEREEEEDEESELDFG